MNRLKKYIAGFLLSVFALGVIPAPIFHEVFADHTDAVDNHCRYFHKDIGTHIEEHQNHCDIFNADTPLYDAVKIEQTLVSPLTIISRYKTGETFSFSLARALRLPSRAPPIA